MRVEATFFAEYAAPSFEIDQGEVVTFSNKDPFLTHGVTSDGSSGGHPLFEAPVLKWKQTSLLRGAPFLTTGTYPFHCPVHPSMTSELEVTSSGTPLPPDVTAPAAVVKLRRTTLAALTKRRKLKLKTTPAEILDVVFTARAGGVRLATARKTYLGTAPRKLVMKLSRATVRSLKKRVAELIGRSRRALKLTVSAALTDIAGNQAVSRGALRLRLPVPARRSRGKAR